MNSALTLRDLAFDDAAGVDAIAAFLDGLSHEARLAETRALGRDAQRRLYRKFRYRDATSSPASTSAMK
jgi:hypothetical protein